MAKIKTQITLDEEIFKSIDGFAKINGISRSGAISVLCTKALQSDKALTDLSKLNELLQGSNA